MQWDTALIRGVAVKRSVVVERSHCWCSGRTGTRIRQSWQQGRLSLQIHATIADGLASLHPLEANVIAIRELVDEVCLVSRAELLEAIEFFCWRARGCGSLGAAAAAFFQIRPLTPMPVCSWSRVQTCPRKFFVERSPRNFDGHHYRLLSEEALIAEAFPASHRAWRSSRER